MKFDRNMKDVEDKEEGGGFNQPPEGTYILGVVSAEDGHSKAGKPMFTLDLDIAEGQYKGTFSKYPLKSYHVYSSDEQYERLKTLLRSFQKSNPDYIHDRDIERDGFDERKLVGLVIGGRINHEEYNGKLYCKIQWLISTERARETMEETKPVSEQDYPF